MEENVKENVEEDVKEDVEEFCKREAKPKEEVVMGAG